MIGVDLTYKLRSPFGSWFLGPKPLVQQVMATRVMYFMNVLCQEGTSAVIVGAY